MFEAGEFVEAPPEIWRTNYQLPAWSVVLTQRSAPYKIVYGGRNSSKSWAVAAALLYLITQSKRPLTVMIMRETDCAIEDSGLKLCADLINLIYAGQGWQVFKRTIRFPGNGSTIRFRGLSDVTESSLRSVEGVDIFWFEEGQYMSTRSFETLLPTVRGGAELWITFNPRYRQDPVWTTFLTGTARSRQAIIVQVNYDSNPWLSDRDRNEIEAAKIDEPDRFPHIYLGVPDDEGATRKVMPYVMVQACVEAWEKWAPANQYQPTGRIHAGLDIADTGADWNALTARRGPLIWHAERWSGSRHVKPRGMDDEAFDEVKSLFMQTVQRADGWCREHDASRLYYDAGGIGGPSRSIFTELGRGRRGGYVRRGEKDGGAVRGKEVAYNRSEKNEDHFHRRKDQMGWTLHLRGMRTQRLLDGHQVNPDHCLFIDRSGIQNASLFMDQLSQPEWEENSSGKIVIEKQPKVREGSTAKMPSPDFYDSTKYSYAWDSRRGLKARAS